MLSCLSALQAASVCGATAGVEDEGEGMDMEDRGERVSAAVRVQARGQLNDLLAFLSNPLQ